MFYNKIIIKIEWSIIFLRIWYIFFYGIREKDENLFELDNFFGVLKWDGVIDVSIFDYEFLFCCLINYLMVDLNLWCLFVFVF